MEAPDEASRIEARCFTDYLLLITNYFASLHLRLQLRHPRREGTHIQRRDPRVP